MQVRLVWVAGVGTGLEALEAGRGGQGRPLALGRHDYTVRSMDAGSGAERWNVTYARLRAIVRPVSVVEEDGEAGGPVDVGCALGGAWPASTACTAMT